MRQITLNIPDETFVALHATPDSLGSELRLAAAIKLFEIGRLTSGAAATLAGIPRTVFLARLSGYRVATFTQDEDELRRDLANAWDHPGFDSCCPEGLLCEAKEGLVI
jgi:predicted HTH domain antitoxin